MNLKGERVQILSKLYKPRLVIPLITIYIVYFKINGNTKESESKQFIFNAYLVNLIKNKTYIPLYNTV